MSDNIVAPAYCMTIKPGQLIHVVTSNIAFVMVVCSHRL